MQNTNNVLLIRPCFFQYNIETSTTKSFQQNSNTDNTLQSKILLEFDNVLSTLHTNGLQVIVFEDTLSPHKPDAIFPNNWFTTHDNGTIILYPMYTSNRRNEVREDIIDKLCTTFNYTTILDFTPKANEQVYVEGTGSIVFNHITKTAFACRSPRTNEGLVKEISEILNYKPIFFSALDTNGTEIYHTNVILSITPHIAIICSQCIEIETERSVVLGALSKADLTIISINFEQVKKMAGNVLSLQNKKGKDYLIMSTTAFKAFTVTQLETIEQNHQIITVHIPLIEKIGGGGVRCMLAEIFLPL